jgi:hypothetical protein
LLRYAIGLRHAIGWGPNGRAALERPVHRRKCCVNELRQVLPIRQHPVRRQQYRNTE